MVVSGAVVGSSYHEEVWKKECWTQVVFSDKEDVYVYVYVYIYVIRKCKEQVYQGLALKKKKVL